MQKWVEKMGQIFEKIWSTAKAPVLAICLSAAMLLYLPPEALVRFGVDTFVEQNRSYIGVSFLSSIIVLVTNLLMQLIKFLREKVDDWQMKRNMRDIIINLTPDERGVVATFLLSKETHIELPFNHPIGPQLRSKMILFTFQQITDGTTMSHGLSPWVHDLYKKEPELFWPKGTSID